MYYNIYHPLKGNYFGKKELKDECDISHEIMECREQGAQLLTLPLGLDSHNKSHYTRCAVQLVVNVYELD